MVKTPIALAIASALFVGCGHGGGPAAPQGWQPVPGATAAWRTGSGARAQVYRYSSGPFGGTLQDLASTVTIDVLLHHRGARLEGSVPLAPCPGAAGVATFLLPSGRRLEEGFAVAGKTSIRTTYVRPADAAPDPNVLPAMQKTLCVTPG